MQIKTKDVANAAKLYDEYRTTGNRAEYIAPAHTDLVKDKVIVTSAAPAGKAGSQQNRRSSVNFVRSAQVPAAEEGKTQLKDAKIEILASLPVGMVDAQFNELCANAAGFFSDPVQVKNVLRVGRIS